MHNKRLKKEMQHGPLQTDYRQPDKKNSVFRWSGSGDLPVMLNRTEPTEPRISAPLPQ